MPDIERFSVPVEPELELCAVVHLQAVPRLGFLVPSPALTVRRSGAKVSTRNEEKLKDTWSGSGRAVKALEGAVRRNIGRLIEEMAKTDL